MGTFNEATTKPAPLTQNEVDTACATIFEKVKAKDYSGAVADLGFISSQNDGISKASSDEQLTALLEIEAMNREALFDTLADNDDTPPEFLKMVAARFGIEFDETSEPDVEQILEQVHNMEPELEPEAPAPV